MSLMLKLLATLLLLNSALIANSNKLVEEFLSESFKRNPSVSSVKVNILDKVPVDSMKGWDAVIVEVDATVSKPKKRNIKQKMIWFVNGDIITQELTDMETGESLKDSVSPKMKSHHYKRENLIYGNLNAKHKVAIFSDPLCPFCSMYVPKAINYMKKYPNRFAIYYYHFPLPSIHPAAIELSKAAIAAELKGRKNVVLDLYKVKINPKERDVKKILKAFNKVLKTDIKPSDISAKEVIKHYNSDQSIIEDLMVQGTPTVFFNGMIDRTKRKYEKAK